MGSFRTCGHETQVLDQHEGQYVCVSCGLVTSPYFTEDYKFHNEILSEGDIWFKEVRDILDRVNVTSSSICDEVIQYLNTHFERKSKESLLFSVYKVLNDQVGICLSLHELCNICAVSKSKVYEKQKVNQNVTVDKTILVEKYCAMLNLTYKTTSLIKEKLSKHRLSGHTPLTIIAGTIYLVCKSLKEKITVKKVSQVTSVSQISIRRFIKYDSSQR